MRHFLPAALALLLLAECEWHTYDGQVEIYIPEEQFVAIKRGMTGEEVSGAIGTQPRRKEASGTNEVWHYTVWRGEKPSLLRWLFSSSPPRPALLDGRIEFAGGRVVRVNVVESSAIQLARPPTPP